MKEAIGTSMVFNLILIFTGVFIALLVGSLSYSKGFKVRNKIIDLIERNEGYNDTAKLQIDQNLSDIGYYLAINRQCEERDGAQPIDNDSPYRYCVYEYTTSKGKYYGVQVFIHFDFPLIGNFIEIPLYGESRILFEKNEVEG